VIFVACGGSSIDDAIERHDIPQALKHYRQVRASDGPDKRELLHIAQALLIQEARNPQQPAWRRALAAMQQGKVLGEQGLQEVAEYGEQPTNIVAWSMLVEKGQGFDEDELRALVNSPDSDTRAAALQAWDGERESKAILEYINDPSSIVRQAALKRLRATRPQPSLVAKVAESARLDPDSEVRLTALFTLGFYGEPARRYLLESVQSSDERLEFAALSALFRVSATDARAHVLRTLGESQVSSRGLLCAGTLARHRTTLDDHAAIVAYLLRGLASSHPPLRAQAALEANAFSAVPRELISDIKKRLARENVAEVRLSMARTLARTKSEATLYWGTLKGLLKVRGMVSLMAAGDLLAARHPGAVRRLQRGLASKSPHERLFAARTLAADRHTWEHALPALEDKHPDVKVAAAGALLAAHGCDE